MANYVTGTSDKTKAGALKWWRNGALGLLGLEYFYVGKVKAGIGRLILGVFWLLFGVVTIAVGVSQKSVSSFFTGFVIFLGGWALLSILDLYRIKIGKFRDNVGNVLRQ